MPNQTYGEAGASSGPSATVPFGQAQNLDKLEQVGRQVGDERQPGQPQAAPGPQGAPPQQPGPQSPDAQPPDQDPFRFLPSTLGPDQIRGNQVFTPPPQPVQPWQTVLRVLAQHPQSRVLRGLVGVMEGRLPRRLGG